MPSDGIARRTEILNTHLRLRVPMRPGVPKVPKESVHWPARRLSAATSRTRRQQTSCPGTWRIECTKKKGPSLGAPRASGLVSLAQKISRLKPAQLQQPNVTPVGDGKFHLSIEQATCRSEKPRTPRIQACFLGAWVESGRVIQAIEIRRFDIMDLVGRYRRDRISHKSGKTGVISVVAR